MAVNDKNSIFLGRNSDFLVTIADREGNIVVVECNCEEMKIIRYSNDEGVVVAANEFVSDR